MKCVVKASSGVTTVVASLVEALSKATDMVNVGDDVVEVYELVRVVKAERKVVVCKVSTTSEPEAEVA
jgi:hypothetical protein